MALSLKVQLLSLSTGNDCENKCRELAFIGREHDRGTRISP